MKIHTAFALSLSGVFFIVLAWWLGVRNEVPDGNAINPEQGRTTTPGTQKQPDTSLWKRGGGEHSSYEEGVYSWLDDDYRQSYSVRGFKEVIVLEEAKNLLTQTWESAETVDSASFTIHLTASASQDLYSFAGFGRNGDLVLEAWDLVLRDRPGLGGGTIPPASSTVLEAMRFDKREIFRGSLCEKILGLEYDADGRYHILFGESQGVRTVYQIANIEGATPVPIMDSVGFPELLTMQFMTKFEHQDLGRTLVFENGVSASMKFIAIDSDNDGVFEGPPLSDSTANLEASGLDHYTKWNSLISSP